MGMWYVVRVCLITLFLSGVSLSVQAEKVDFLDDDFYQEEVDNSSVKDPLEPFNRVMFDVNDAAYDYFLKPVATGYKAVLPADIRGCVGNFFNNLQAPVRFINCILQGRFEESFWVLSRFAINSTAGAFGLADPAAREFGIPQIEASLGETLATWGIGDGFYLVVPFYGATTMTDFTGKLIETMGYPYYYVSEDYLEKSAVLVLKGTNTLSLNINVYDELKKVSFDPYIALRNSYFQNRKKARDHSDFKVEFDL
ncbi:MAG: VacJ family lipoprotein [Desulfobulbus propionicus]|nr:MAG: VacJ family lipoprotein [Desulfobulbus propionicus]PIE60415.1 MAG: VacJ family lipoprotein [Desulfobulbus propionicus]